MDKDEENKYVSQLSEVFSSCDTTGTGYLDKDELTELCRKLHLEAQLPILLQTLLGNDHFARVNFEEFKEGFVAVLSRTIDLSISEDESSYLQPVIPEEVKPKFVKGAKRYGRRSRPEVQASNVESTKYLQEHQVNGNRKSQLRRSSSLESVESLKSDEEAESGKDAQNEIFEAQGEMRSWNADILDSPRRASSPCSDMTENQVRDIWIELDVGNNGYLNKQELATVCQSIGLKDLKNEEVEDLFHKLDQDGDGRVSFKEFQLGLFSHGPTSLPITSTPFRQKRQWSLHQALEESGRTPSLLSSCGGLHLFSSIDDGTGFVNPEQIITIWEQEGLEDSKEILQSLDFSLEEQVNLADLTMILDKEMATTQSRVHQAGLASYRQELQHLRGQVEQISREKEKVKKDFERAEMRNRQLTSEVDDHHSVMELLNQSKISDLEHDYKEKVAAVRSELVKESEMLVQQADQQRAKLEADLSKMQREDTVVREKLTLCLKENSRLQKEMMEVVGRASESEKSVLKLQKDLDLMLSERCKFMDPQSTEHFDREERFAEIIREYETQCRELRDRNDELQVELEKLRSQLNENKHHNLLSRRKDLKQLLMKSKINSNLNAENLGKNKLSFKLGRSSSTLGINGIISKEINPNSYPLSIEAELTKEQLKEHQQQLQDLRIQLETKVNYYEREIELMKRNYEQERKDTEQGFKIEVSELEEQKSDLEELNAKLEDVIKGLKDQLQKLPQSQEIEKRFEKERAEMEQNYAKEISNLAQSLTQEREQLKVELKRSHQHELQFTRKEAEVEFNQKLSQAEAQFTEKVKTLWHQHRCEMEDLVRQHEATLDRIEEKHAQEKKQWGEKEAKIVMESRKERLKYEERMNEEQATICKTFAIERETMENDYKKQIDALTSEIENLQMCSIVDQKQSQKISVYPGDDYPQSPQNMPNHLESSTDFKGEQFARSKDLYSQQVSKNSVLLYSPGAKDWKMKEDSSERESEFQPKLKERDSHPQEQMPQLENQSELYAEALLCIKANEEKVSALKKAQQEALIQLEHALSEKALLEEDLRAKEKLLADEESLLNKQLSEKLQTKEEELQMIQMKEGDLTSQLEQTFERINVQELEFQELAKEREIHVEQVRCLQEEMALLKVAKEEMLKQQLLFEMEQEKKDVIIAQKTELLNAFTETKEELFRKLRSAEEELASLRRRNEESMEQRQLKDDFEVSAYQVRTDEEKNQLKDKLLHLEDLVRQLEAETGPRLDDRIELNRLSEDNCVLKNNIEKVQQEVDAATAENRKWRINAEKLQNEIAAYTHQNKTFKDEVGLLTDRNLQLSDAVADLCAKAEESQQTIQLLNQRLAELSGQKEEEAAVARQLQETVESLEREQIQKESTWMRECGRSAQELHTLRETVTNMTSRHQLLQMEKEEMLKEAEVNKRKVAKMTFEHQLLQQEKEETLQEAEENKKQVLNLTLQLELLQQEKEGILQEIEENKKQLANLTLQHQLLQQEKETFLREAEENQKKLFRMDSLMQEVNALKLEKHCLEDRCQGMAKGLKDYADQVPRMHTIESELQRVNLECQALRQKEAQLREELVTAQHQVSQMHRLESELQRVNLECQALRPKEAQLREELLAAQDQAAQMHRLESELQRVNLECQTLRQKEAQLREELVEAQDQLLEANTRLTLAESQHMREVQHLKEKIHGAVPKDQLNKLQAKLQEAQEKVRQLQESLRLQAEQAHKQLALQQEQHEKLLRRMEEKMLEVEMNLKTVRVMLQEKVKQLKEQLEKNAKSDMLLKDLYVENAQLMKALQVTEQRQKSAEKKNFILDEKIAALNKLIRNIAPASLSA
ncbi:ninein-like protein isoform X2 [Ambystoma mexicanum]|uniref:ninein-like protein isoform X2 n=1 Tax=Ambystoma mexicanum TaxID=8296 RepID=UPI0037E7103E